MKRLITIVLVLILLLVMVPTQPALAATKVIDLQVSAQSDNCRLAYSGSTWDFSVTTDISVGYYSSSYYRMESGMRFTKVAVPRDAVITEACLTLVANRSDSSEDVDSKIRGEDANNPSAFTNSSNFFDRDRTSEKVSWNNIVDWDKNEEVDSPDISEVIQEIVDRSGWRSGNAMVIFWGDWDDRSAHTNGTSRRAYSYSQSSKNAPRLHIEYTYANDDVDDVDSTVLEELEVQIDSLETQVSTLNTRLVEMTALIVVFRGYVSDLGKESSLRRTEYASLNSKFGTEMSTLRTEVAGLKTSLEDIKSAVVGLEAKVYASERHSLEYFEVRLTEVKSELSGKSTPTFWLSLLTLVLLMVIGYCVLRRQR